MASVVEQINQNTALIIAGKDRIEEAIIEKGGTVPENPVSGVPTFSNLVEGINSISGGGNTLIYPQSPQSSIVRYNFGSDGNFQLQLGKVTSQSYDRTYAVVRKPANTIEFPISESELIDVGSNVDTFTVPNTSGEETFSVMLITKDKAGNYQTVKTINNVMEGVKGIGAKGMFVEAVLPEELQQYSSFNAVLTSKGRLLVSSNTSSCKGLWSYIDGAFVKVYDNFYNWTLIGEAGGMTCISNMKEVGKVLQVLDDGNVKEMYTCTRSIIIAPHIPTLQSKAGDLYFGFDNKVLRYNKETQVLDSLYTAGTTTDMAKLIELENGNILFVPDYGGSPIREYNPSTNEVSSVDILIGSYVEHKYVNDNLILVLNKSTSPSAYYIINYKNKDSYSYYTISGYTGSHAVRTYITRKGYLYVTGPKVCRLNIDTMTEEVGDFTNSKGVYRYIDDEDGNLFFYNDNRSTKYFYFVNEETNTVELIDDASLQTKYTPLLYVLSKNKLFIQYSNTKSIIFDTLNKTILQQIDEGIGYYDNFIKLSSNITLLTSRPNSDRDGVLIINASDNTITKIEDVGVYYGDDTGDYLYPSKYRNNATTSLIQVLKINPTTGATEGINAYCHKYLGQGLGIDLTNKIIYKKEQTIGTFLGDYTGAPTTNNSVFYFLFDTSSEEKKVLFTY